MTDHIKRLQELGAELNTDGAPYASRQILITVLDLVVKELQELHTRKTSKPIAQPVKEPASKPVKPTVHACSEILQKLIKEKIDGIPILDQDTGQSYHLVVRQGTVLLEEYS